MTRQIIHLDLDAFYASVETLLNPELKGKPLIVSMGSLNARGVVATASYEARKFGVHSAMSLREAVRLCPKAIIAPVRHHVYSEHSQRVMKVLREASPLVEQVSIDEAYVEIADARDAVQVAKEIQARITNELGLSCTLAVATNKLLSKVACNTVKPRGFIIVHAGDEEKFLAPLPIEKLPYAGPKTRARLAARWNVKLIGDLTRVSMDALRAQFGKQGEYLYHAARGQDDSPVVTDAKTKSISQENTFERDTRDLKKAEEYVIEMSEGVAKELKREAFRARTIVLKLRYGDFTTQTRQTTLRVPTSDANEIRACVLKLLNENWDRQRALRLVGVGAHNLVEEASVWQMEMGLTDG